MAKFIYTPRVSDLWKNVEGHLDDDNPALLAAAQTVVAKLEERDHQLESALLGDLIVNNVSGSLGSTPPAARQIGWSVNFGYFEGTTTGPDGDGKVYLDIPYDKPFPIDTAVVIPQGVYSGPGTAFIALVVAGSADRNGFTVAGFDVAPVDIAIVYCAVGF